MAQGIGPDEIGDGLVIDVRSAEEFAAGHAPGARNIPTDMLHAVVGTLPHDRRIVLVCTKGGARSQGAAEALVAAGLDAVYLIGGVRALGIEADH